MGKPRAVRPAAKKGSIKAPLSPPPPPTNDAEDPPPSKAKRKRDKGKTVNSSSSPSPSPPLRPKKSSSERSGASKSKSASRSLLRKHAVTLGKIKPLHLIILGGLITFLVVARSESRAYKINLEDRKHPLSSSAKGRLSGKHEPPNLHTTKIGPSNLQSSPLPIETHATVDKQDAVFSSRQSPGEDIQTKRDPADFDLDKSVGSLGAQPELDIDFQKNKQRNNDIDGLDPSLSDKLSGNVEWGTTKATFVSRKVSPGRTAQTSGSFDTAGEGENSADSQDLHSWNRDLDQRLSSHTGRSTNMDSSELSSDDIFDPHSPAPGSVCVLLYGRLEALDLTARSILEYIVSPLKAHVVAYLYTSNTEDKSEEIKAKLDQLHPLSVKIESQRSLVQDVSPDCQSQYMYKSEMGGIQTVMRRLHSIKSASALMQNLDTHPEWIILVNSATKIFSPVHIPMDHKSAILSPPITDYVIDGLCDRMMIINKASWHAVIQRNIALESDTTEAGMSICQSRWTMDGLLKQCLSQAEIKVYDQAKHLPAICTVGRAGECVSREEIKAVLARTNLPIRAKFEKRNLDDEIPGFGGESAPIRNPEDSSATVLYVGTLGGTDGNRCQKACCMESKCQGATWFPQVEDSDVWLGWMEKWAGHCYLRTDKKAGYVTAAEEVGMRSVTVDKLLAIDDGDLRLTDWPCESGEIV